MTDYFRGCCLALILGGGLLIFINVIITPSYLASFKQGEAVARASGIYLLRISLALVDVSLLLFGSTGLYLNHKAASGTFGTAAFLATFLGTSLLLAIEWSNLFVLRPVAQTSPEALGLLDKSSLMTAGTASGAGIFMLGWLLLAMSLWRANLSPQWAAPATIAGIILIPILGFTPLGVIGQVIGNVVFGLGLIGFGYSLL
jgi:hypothetical protein